MQMKLLPPLLLQEGAFFRGLQSVEIEVKLEVLSMLFIQAVMAAVFDCRYLLKT
jgi:hypothetical protein